MFNKLRSHWIRPAALAAVAIAAAAIFAVNADEASARRGGGGKTICCRYEGGCVKPQAKGCRLVDCAPPCNIDSCITCIWKCADGTHVTSCAGFGG